ncbi:hypothetical protein [Streptomyces sp. NPDC050416]|uniref:hypothetical protein n=1 Tax=Streptomyces sp. NPDC050416 TaxID=3365611 RepID=UPI0037B53309
MEESAESLVFGIGRVLAGRDLDGVKRTDATFWRSGTRVLPKVEGRLPRRSHKAGWRRLSFRVALGAGVWETGYLATQDLEATVQTAQKLWDNREQAWPPWSERWLRYRSLQPEVGQLLECVRSELRAPRFRVREKATGSFPSGPSSTPPSPPAPATKTAGGLRPGFPSTQFPPAARLPPITAPGRASRQRKTIPGGGQVMVSKASISST